MGVLIHHLPRAHLHQALMPGIVSFDHGRLLNGHGWTLRKLIHKVSWHNLIKFTNGKLRASSRSDRAKCLEHTLCPEFYIALTVHLGMIFVNNQLDTQFFFVVRPCSENGRRKITQNSIEVDAGTKESTRKTEGKLDGMYKEGHERNKPKWRPMGRQEAVESRCRTT